MFFDRYGGIMTFQLEECKLEDLSSCVGVLPEMGFCPGTFLY